MDNPQKSRRRPKLLNPIKRKSTKAAFKLERKCLKWRFKHLTF